MPMALVRRLNGFNDVVYALSLFCDHPRQCANFLQGCPQDGNCLLVHVHSDERRGGIKEQGEGETVRGMSEQVVV